MSKMGKTMIAACSVAIGSIYATGYINTLSDAQAVQVTPAHHQKKREIRQTIKRLLMITGEKISLLLISTLHQRVPKVLLLKQNTKMERILVKEATVSELFTYM